MIRACLLLTCLLLSGCGASDDSGFATIRLARQDIIESVESRDLEIVRREAPVPVVPSDETVVEGRAGWGFFLVGDLFESNEEVNRVRELPVDLLTKIEDDSLFVNSAVGAAYWFDIDSLAPLILAVDGTFDEGSGLEVSAMALDCPASPMDVTADSRRLREVMEDSARTRPLKLIRTPSGRSARLLFTPLEGSRSVLVFCSTSGQRLERVDRLRIGYPSVFHWLVSRRQIDENFIGEFEVGGITRPGIALTPGTIVRTRGFLAPEQAELVLDAARLSPDTGEVLIEVELLPEPGHEGTRIELLRLEPGAVSVNWMPGVASLHTYAGRQMRLVFSYHAEPGDERPVYVLGAPRVRQTTPRAGRNLLIISLDTLRADRLGCYGNERGLTPHIDELARDATLFEQAYTHAPYTLASHVTMLSGLLPDAHGVEDFRDRVPFELPWLPALLADAGYRTAAFTSGGYVSSEFGFGRGFDQYCEINPIGHLYFPGHVRGRSRFPDGATGGLSRALVELDQSCSRPLFLFLHTYIVHDYLPPEPLAREFGLLGPGKPELSFDTIKRFESLEVARHGLAPDDRRLLVDAYDATVKAADSMVGEVLERLREAGTYDDTIIVVTSDHGEELLEHGGTGHGITLYEEVVRVPLLIRVPGLGDGLRVEERVGLVDLLPTLAEALGQPVPAGLQGRSLVPRFAGGAVAERRILTMVNDPPRSVRSAIIENDTKLIVSDDGAQMVVRPADLVELFRLDEDPSERTNRTGVQANITALLRSRMTTAAMESAAIQVLFQGDGDPEELSPEVRDRLKELGYLGGK